MLMPYMLTLWAFSVLKPMTTHLRSLIILSAPGVGDVDGDRVRNWDANFAAINYHLFQNISGIAVGSGGGNVVPSGSTYGVGFSNIQMILNRVVPTGPANAPSAGVRLRAAGSAPRRHDAGWPRYAQANAPHRRGANAGPTGI